jgi:predicted CoA-substrate-specific enzyme activase
MKYSAGIDVGSTYTKAVILGEDLRIASRTMRNTGFKLDEVSRKVYQEAIKLAGLAESEICYVVATGCGRHQSSFADATATDLTAAATGCCFLYPGTRTILDIGGQTMKATRVDGSGKVKSFRLNDKCAAGTGAFIEKTARYMGFGTEEIGPLVGTSKQAVPISGVCAVFAESEVINQLSLGSAPADIMHGAMASLVERSIQLMKRIQLEPEFTLIGGIMRFATMARLMAEQLKATVNVPERDLAQYAPALGAAVLGLRRWQKINSINTQPSSDHVDELVGHAV